MLQTPYLSLPHHDFWNMHSGCSNKQISFKILILVIIMHGVVRFIYRGIQKELTGFGSYKVFKNIALLSWQRVSELWI